MAHKQCIDKLDKKCDCIKDDLELLKKLDKIILKVKDTFIINSYNDWGSRIDQEVRSAIDVFCKLLIKEIK